MACEAGGLDFGGAAPVELRGDGQAEHQLLFPAEQTGLYFPNVIALVDGLQQVDIRSADLDDFLRPQDAALQQHVL